MKMAILAVVLYVPHILCAQAIDNTPLYKNIAGDRYFRVNYENDYFSARDRFYTQGVVFELAHPSLRGNPVNYILPSLRNGTKKFVLALEHDAYTPTSILATAILTGDRPYAASLFFTGTKITTDIRQKLAAGLSLGVVGAAAGGENVQTNIHKWTGNIIPLGWTHQVASDVVANYSLGYERQILSAGNYLMLTAVCFARAGTLSTKLSAGPSIMIGYNVPRFKGDEQKIRTYFYAHPTVNLIGYDATLQGGLFNKSSPYVVDAADISRLTLGNRAGMAIIYKRLHVEYFQSFLTKEFSTQADEHRWGGIQLGWRL